MSQATPHHAMQVFHDRLQEIVNDIARAANAAGTPRVELTRPNNEKFGDYATNVALMLAPVVRDNPRSVAMQVADRAREIPGVANVDVAGPGFVNLTLADDWYIETLGAVLAQGDRFGAGSPATPERALLEFVSANPTGPLVAASARHAAYGDSLARVMRFAGHDVATEYYVNDAGRQVELFGESILARATGTAVPEGGYEGDYVAGIARDLGAGEGDDPRELGRRGVQLMLDRSQPLLERFRVSFDRFRMESELHEGGLVEEAIERVRSLGQTYERDDALWLRTTAFGDDKDRTIVRSNGVPTYFAADIGYLLDKYRRGAGRLLYVLGADHHGYVARLQAAAAALGYDPETCEVVIMQLVHLLEGGEQKKMSKRRGDFVSMEELLDRISIDAARFMLVQRSHDQTIELDLDLAVEQSEKNPVYYVQYAHARICSIMRRAEQELGIGGADVALPDVEQLRSAAAARGDGAAGRQLLDPAERRLIKRIAEFPVLVQEVAERRSPHKLTHFAHDLASDFSQFYRDCRVVGEGVSRETTLQRLSLCQAARTVLARSLDLVGVDAPESM